MANTAKAKYLTDSNGDKFYPIGHTDAIYDSDGNTLSSVLSTPPENRTYSTTPQQIGTWTDGTPVWRVALPYILMKDGVREVSVDSQSNKVDVRIDELVASFILNKRYNVGDVVYQNVQISWYSENIGTLTNQAPMIDSRIIFCEGDAARFEDFIEFDNGYWGGYIDFAITADAFEVS